MKASAFFSKEEQKQIVQCIKDAEYQTSGEIRVHLENNCPGNVLDRAVQIFTKLKMHKTELRNGVLIYLAINDKKFAIIGDAGINKAVPVDFWDNIKNNMSEHFKKGEFYTGICEGITQSGIQLKTHFPYKSDDVNELSDDISFGKD